MNIDTHKSISSAQSPRQDDENTGSLRVLIIVDIEWTSFSEITFPISPLNIEKTVSAH